MAPSRPTSWPPPASGSVGAAFGPLLCFALLWQLPGCTSTNELGGKWRPVETDGTIIRNPAPGGDDLGFELVMEHYGPDIAGLIRFYRNTEYERSRDPKSPFSECACVYMRSGTYGAKSKSYRFRTEGCVPGVATHSNIALRGALELNDESQLVGTLRVEDLNHPSEINGLVQNMVLEREATAGAILASEFSCERPANADAGNTHSGR